MAINDKLLGGATGDAPSSLDPRDNFGTVLYTGNGSSQSINGGKYDAAASFNGSSSKIDLPNLGISGAGVRTISAWINVNSLSAAQTIFQFGASAAGERFGFAIDTAGKLYVEYYGRDAITSSAQITTGSWFNVAVTYNGGAIETATNTQIYVNGSAVAMSTTGTSTGAANTGDSNYGIGYRRPSTSQYFNGLIDQVRIYNSALSASDVSALASESYANSFKPNFPSGQTAKVLMRLNGNANDETGAYDGTASNVTWKYGVNFTPDMVWLKSRTSTTWHNLQDSIRGTTKHVYPNETNAEDTTATGVTSFDTGGFTLGSANGFNTSAATYVAWCFNAGGSSATNNEGSITSTVRANQDAGFSIINYTGTSASSQSAGHGLSAAPELVFIKNLSGGDGWIVWYPSAGTDGWLELNSNNGSQTGATWGGVPTSTLIHLQNGPSARSSGNGNSYIAYCWHSVAGYSKVGSYTGNGSANGPMVETGFKPAFLMIKCTSSASTNWRILDSARNPSNPINKELYPSLSNGEGTYTAVNFYSDGFQVINTDVSYNTNNETYLYFAIAEPPETTTPVVADSFNISTWTGNDSTVNPRNVEMTFGGEKPGLMWIKARDNGNNNHQLYDIVRGAGSSKNIQSNENYYEGQYASTYGYLSNINTDGFELTTGSSNANFVNENGATYVGWGWKTSGSSEILTGSGSNNDVVASVNDNAGFSILTYEGTGSSGMKIRHGLSATPAMVIVKKLDANAAAWMVWVDQGLTDFDYYLNLNTNGGQVDSVGTGFSAAPDANLLTFGTSGIGNDANLRYVAYCWRRISGYSGFGTYTGNGGSNPITINDGGSGFQPNFVMSKPIGTGSWIMIDSVRGANKQLYSDLASAEGTESGNSFTSTGFEFGASTGGNTDSVAYTYAAFKIN